LASVTKSYMNRYIIASIIAFVFGCYSTHAQTKQSDRVIQGDTLFTKTCMACHTINKGILIGPDLAGVTEKYDFQEV
jgi:cytochrome c2